jgi:hypothetical protein
MPETSSDQHTLATVLRRELLQLAAREDHLAAAEAAVVPYWRRIPHPSKGTAPPPRLCAPGPTNC